jgi:hypothetical protein
MIPKAPPARSNGMFGPSASNFKYAIPSMRKAKSKVRNKKLNATVDLSVRMKRRNVKMNQPY